MANRRMTDTIVSLCKAFKDWQSEHGLYLATSPRFPSTLRMATSPPTSGSGCARSFSAGTPPATGKGRARSPPNALRAGNLTVKGQGPICRLKLRPAI